MCKAKASRAFGALRKAVFRDNNLSHKTKRLVYKAAVSGVLLYGSEAWTTPRAVSKRLEVFQSVSEGNSGYYSNAAMVRSLE